MRHGNLRHYNRVGEVIERHTGGANPTMTMQTWRTSRSHRRVLLGPHYQWIGAGFARGRIDGRLSTVWVARLAGR